MKNSQWRSKIVKRNPEIFKTLGAFELEKKKPLFSTLKSENYLPSLSILET